MSEFCCENIFHSHFLTVPTSDTNHIGQTARKENYCGFYLTLLHNYTPIHSLIERRRCDENHPLKINRPYMLVLKKLSMRGADQQLLLMQAIPDKRYQLFPPYHCYL